MFVCFTNRGQKSNVIMHNLNYLMVITNELNALHVGLLVRCGVVVVVVV